MMMQHFQYQAAQAQAQAQAWQQQQAQQQAYYNNQAAQYTAAMGGEALYGLMASSSSLKSYVRLPTVVPRCKVSR